jgi:hypothetical protein
LIGAPRGRLRVPLGDSVQVSLAPGGVVGRSDGAELGVEVFGLDPGARATLRILVAPLDSARFGPATALRWRPYSDRQGVATVVRAVGAGPIVPWHTTLPLTKLKPGSWMLAVLATDAAGRTARREARLVITTP